MKKILMLVSLTLLLSGCMVASTLRLPTTALPKLAGKQLHIVSSAPEYMYVMKAQHGLLGTVGKIAAESAAKKLYSQYQFKNPAASAAQDLSRFVVRKYRLSGVGRSFNLSPGAKPKNLVSWAKQRNLNGLLLNVHTVNWGYSYHAFDYSKYWVSYATEIKLFDIQKNKIIASHTCILEPGRDYPRELVNHEVLIANNAAYLRKRFSLISKLCNKDIKAKIF